jgi:hypothetical protein
MEIINREIHTLKSIIAVIVNYKLESEYPRASLDQRIEQLKGQDANMKDRTPASILNQHPLQQQRKRSMEHQQQQQNEIKLPRTSTSVGPAAVLKNITGDNPTICQYQQPPVNPSGLFPEHPYPYIGSPAMPPGMMGPTLTRPSYPGPSAGTYGFAGIPNPISPNLGGSRMIHSAVPHIPSAYYDSNSTYGGINLRHHHQ